MFSVQINRLYLYTAKAVFKPTVTSPAAFVEGKKADMSA